MDLTEGLEQLRIVADDEPTDRDEQLPAGWWNGPLSLLDLLQHVQRRLDHVADQMKARATANEADDSILERYLQLNRVQLGLRLWTDDILVQHKNPLEYIENDANGLEVLVPRLRRYFQEMLSTLDDELFPESV